MLAGFSSFWKRNLEDSLLAFSMFTVFVPDLTEENVNSISIITVVSAATFMFCETYSEETADDNHGHRLLLNLSCLSSEQQPQETRATAENTKSGSEALI